LFYSSTPLNTIFPGVPQSTENVKYQYSEPKVSTVNGIRVVSVESNTPQTSITLSFHSGSRVENNNNRGAATFLKHFAFKVKKKKNL
jgi:hypothetical protein